MTKGQVHVTDDVDITNSNMASLVKWRSRGVEKISHDLNSAAFEEQLRDIDTAITGVAPNLVVPPLTDPISDFEEHKAKKMEILNSNNIVTELDKTVDPADGLTPILGSSEMGRAFESFSSHNITEGQEFTSAQRLFSLGPSTMKPTGGTKIKALSGTVQKKKKHARKLEGKENFMQELKGGEYGAEEV